MSKIPANYLERVYAGWVAKLCGIRLGAAIEGWTYQKIRDVYGELTGYPVDFKEFAADDDSNGPLFFLRALYDLKPGKTLTAQDVGEALLNYAPFEHGFFWWGGYGVSTEHTAYLNLRSGIPAPRSGSIAQNGAAVAEQIGGQIFIDTWGLVAPGNPDLAAHLAREAASVTHDGNGVYGGMFIAAAIALAFVEKDIPAILRRALQYIPFECEYARVVRAVMDYHAAHPDCWRSCFDYIYENFGYDKYPGNCHIIPNIAVMILALMYGGGDFSDTLNICNMCGWDTDCNVGNVATIMGVIVGVEGMDYEKWLKPVHDLLICSSCMGSLNIMDAPYGASFIAMLAYRLAGETPPAPFDEIFARRIDSCHFEYPASTHSLYTRGASEVNLSNTAEWARTGARSLKLAAMALEPAQKIYLYKKTYYQPRDFHDSRYDPCFSPVFYPGQRIRLSVKIPEYSRAAHVRLYAKEQRTGQEFLGERVFLRPGESADLSYSVPAMRGALLGEAGALFEVSGEHGQRGLDFTALADDLILDGAANYAIDFANETREVWTGLHAEVSQMTRVKGLMYLEDGQLNLSCADFAEAYTGRHDFGDYQARYEITPVTGERHTVNFRVQGAIRSYAFGFDGAGRLALLKNENGYRVLDSAPFDWKAGQSYVFEVEARGARLTGRCGGVTLEFVDEAPYLQGAVGVSVRDGGHIRVKSIAVKP